MPRRHHVAGAAVLAACIVGAISAASRAAEDKQDFATIERGRYLTIVGDCAACHTASDKVPFAGGRAIPTPFGTLLASNITPDPETGIGRWTDQQFIDALTKGVRSGGGHLYPAMPYTYYAKAKRDDLLAIRAYLATIEPVSRRVRSNQLPFPFNIRATMRVWNALFFRFVDVQPRSDKSADWNRGAYLVEGLMHCGMCHTPKNVFGADKTDARLQGYPLQGWFAPDLTTDNKRGLGAWSIDDIVDYLKTGHNRFAAASGPMADEVSQSSSEVTDADLHAVATYLKDTPTPAGESGAFAKPDDAAMKMGGAIYSDECSACHTPTGEGIAGLFPKLAGSPSVQSSDPTSIIHMILAGARGVATDGAPTASAMPPFGWLLSNDQVAAVATFIRNTWGNAAPQVTARMVSDLRRSADLRD
ncbi:MAG TPA: c-type cytochrome [Beijerinckiaceae bacterium]|nr:c-type cytochrome [Beijerinckiaceae bacterium]